MSVIPELLDTPSPATRAESAALLVEVVNIALYGDKDPWNSDFLERDAGVQFESIDKGHIAEATPKSGGPNIQCKYDPKARGGLLYGSEEKVHIAALAIGKKTYDIFASTTEYHFDEDGKDVLVEMFNLLEHNEGIEEIETARQLDFQTLAEDVTIEVFEDLPQHGSFMRNLGELGVRFAELVDDETSPSQIAESEGLIAQAVSSDASLAMELSLSATTIDSATAQALTSALREDYEPEARW